MSQKGTTSGSGEDEAQDSAPHSDPLYRIDSRHLRHFLAAVRCRGFTTAAEQLNITQPALSRSIRSLEDHLGVKLIERTSKTFQLTEFGVLLSDRGSAIELELDHTLAEIEALKKGYSGSISVGVGYASVIYLPAAISEFQSLRPDISVRVVQDRMEANYEALLNGKLDFICTALHFAEHSNLVIEKLSESHNIILASRSHPLAGDQIVDPAELLKYPWIFFTDDQMGYRRVAGYFAANQLEPPPITVEINTVEGLCGLLTQGNYLASAPSLLIRYIQQSDLQIAPVPIEGSFWSTELGVAYASHVKPSLAAASLIGTMKKHLKRLEAA